MMNLNNIGSYYDAKLERGVGGIPGHITVTGLPAPLAILQICPSIFSTPKALLSEGAVGIQGI